MVNLRRDMIKGLVRLRILRAAVEAPVSGVELALELEAAGHHVGPGTLYPLLHAMQKEGWVKSTARTVKGKRRRYYRATKKGRLQLEQALAGLEQFLAGLVGPSPDDLSSHDAQHNGRHHTEVASGKPAATRSA